MALVGLPNDRRVIGRPDIIARFEVRCGTWEAHRNARLAERPEVIVVTAVRLPKSLHIRKIQEAWPICGRACSGAYMASTDDLRRPSFFPNLRLYTPCGETRRLS